MAGKIRVQKWRENERNNGHDKIVQYFPQSSMAKFWGKI
jgi:hypothetical protein